MAPTKSANSSENLYMQLNASELSAIIMKGSPNSNDRDAGFCSGSSEGGDDYSMDHATVHSPTDASEDSVEVKVMPISLAIRNKRKSSEPSKVVSEKGEQSHCSKGPLKKRIRYTSTSTDSAVVLSPPTSVVTAATPSSPSAAVAATTCTLPAPLWDPSQILPHELMPNPAEVLVRHPGVTTLHRLPENAAEEQQEPLALVLKKQSTPTDMSSPLKNTNASPSKQYTPKKQLQMKRQTTEERQNLCNNISSSSSNNFNTVPLPVRPCASTSVISSNEGDSSCASTSHAHINNASGSSRTQQRNYKNMTRERRIEANARERTRVHTISAAYETLRKSVPSYSNAQKLSKLSVLRVACSYILTLSRMAGHDYSEDQSEPSIASCFEAVTATIQTEGKIKKKKDE